MVKLNRVAVLLAGDFRLWSRASEYIFAFAERQAVVVDYYFATWTTTQDYWYTTDLAMKEKRPVTEADITCEFVKHNKNLINFQLATQLTDITITSNYYQSYLGKIAGIMKRRYELDNNFVYDQVFEIRPDLYIHDEVNAPVTLTDFECLGQIDYKHSNHPMHFPQATDFYYQANSFGHDVMAERYYYQKTIESVKFNLPQYKIKHWPMIMHNHWILTDYIYARRLQLKQLYQPNMQIALRTNFPQDDLRKYDFNQLWEYERQYIARSNR